VHSLRGILHSGGTESIWDKHPKSSQAAMETGIHSPWVSRLLTELRYKVIVAHAQKVQLILTSNRKG
jgi:hypothetical protein